MTQTLQQVVMAIVAGLGLSFGAALFNVLRKKD